MSKEHILVVADYGKESVFAEVVNLELSEQEIEELYTVIWTFHYETSGIKLERQIRKLEWEFKVIHRDLLDVISRRLIKVIKELFSDKLVEFSEENKYD